MIAKLRQKCQRCRSNTRAAINPSWVVLAGVGLFLFAVGMQAVKVIVLRNDVVDEISRAANTAIQMSIEDEYRADHISKVDRSKVQQNIEAYYRDEMGLVEAGAANKLACYSDDGARLRYMLEIQETLYSGYENVTTTTYPSITITGTIHVPVEVFADFLPEGTAFKINFSIRTRNRRIE